MIPGALYRLMKMFSAKVQGFIVYRALISFAILIPDIRIKHFLHVFSQVLIAFILNNVNKIYDIRILQNIR